MIVIGKPKSEDLASIESILRQWTEEEEMVNYSKRVKNEIEGRVEFNMQFWVAKENDRVLGVTGLGDPMPNLAAFGKTAKPGVLKILYVDTKHQEKGVGRTLVAFIEEEAVRQGYQEILLRSAERYKDTAWGFYKKLGYLEVGEMTSSDNKKKLRVFQKTL